MIVPVIDLLRPLRHRERPPVRGAYPCWGWQPSGWPAHTGWLVWVEDNVSEWDVTLGGRVDATLRTAHYYPEGFVLLI